jgi:carboxylate-amine ligase
MTPKPPSLTIGVEEEYQIIDPVTRELKSYINQILESDHVVLRQVKPELHQSIVEVGTTVCRTPQEVREQLIQLRGGVMELAARKGYNIASAGTGKIRKSPRCRATSTRASRWPSWRSSC